MWAKGSPGLGAFSAEPPEASGLLEKTGEDISQSFL